MDNRETTTGPDYVPLRAERRGPCVWELASFIATIAFGLQAIAGVFLFSLWAGDPRAASWTVIAAGLCYGAQLLYTHARVFFGLLAQALAITILVLAVLSARTAAGI